ncbi:ABC transporter ATP-binding protein [Streptosporangium roseum]|uniref:ABC transporter related protein n=1 Tax=Streptosporangium roseum (strain ATCC 12428 / DSM 43021 / JCM 3005 / KCTC 9067 / NCIMB 10171 / NRRL 2505 / NI 9100) TaxID=479432 RepID=D2B531_STRRD|nr:ABC transporter ATP-binding protein [Streptosporangium roseum]ACZ87555.1 ABC transporter related protein [Streptosporangium roseum DSM 43021]
MALLEIRDLRAGYGAAEVLHGVELTVETGGTTALLGANGAGKTTTLRALCGMIRRRGEIVFDGLDITGLSTERIARLGVAHVPQGRGSLANLSVRDNMMVGALLRRDRSAVRGDLDRCLAMFPALAKRVKAAAGTMSGGEQQMLAICRALMSRPKLLVLDEPSLGLAPVITRRVFDALLGFRAEWGVSMLVVEQNANLALGMADRASVLEFGRVVVAGPAAEIAGRDDVRRAYLGT